MIASACISLKVKTRDASRLARELLAILGDIPKLYRRRTPDRRLACCSQRDSTAIPASDASHLGREPTCMHRMLDRASCCVGYNGACASGNQVTPVAFTGIQHLFVTIATIQERSMMLRIDWKKLHLYALAGALMGAASLVVVS